MPNLPTLPSSPTNKDLVGFCIAAARDGATTVDARAELLRQGVALPDANAAIDQTKDSFEFWQQERAPAPKKDSIVNVSKIVIGACLLVGGLALSKSPALSS
jgi:hypothetical protein